MKVTLDVSAAVEMIMGRPKQQAIIDNLKKATWITTPSLYISEVSNVMWKYNSIQNYSAEKLTHKANHLVKLIDEFIPTDELYEEAISLACQLDHPAYDAMYLVASRRRNSTLITLDKKLIQAAQKVNIPVVSL